MEHFHLKSIYDNTGDTDMLKRIFTKIVAELKARKAYHDTFHQINRLSDRDLRDIGVSRSDIYYVALEAAEKRYKEVTGKSRGPSFVVVEGI
jgi:uncharacterized protein YjiS (DUF1127 family)